ncbi:MAG: phage tail length tape measure family protein, partial [Thermoleophilia bacterium]|nr:phage tail length tape measure family protein [Thermoleophilia bacterium]
VANQNVPSATAASGFRPDQWKNLGYQANDIATSLASGIPVTQVLAQQGGQVVQVLGEGPGGIAGGLKAVASGVASVLTPARLLAGGFIGAAAGVAYLGVSWARTQQEIRDGLTGIGTMSRATVGDIERIAETAAAGGRIGRSDARGVASAVAATGQVDVANIADIVGLAPGYSKLFGKDMKETGADLARIFADPVKGADELNARMGGLDAGTRAYVRTLAEQGAQQSAVLAVVRQFSPEFKAAAEATSAWAHAWEFLGSVAEATGKIVAAPFVAGTLAEQLAAVEERLRQAQAATRLPTVIGGGPDLARRRAGANIAPLEAERDRLRQRISDDEAAPGRKLAAALSRQAEEAVRGLQPEIDQLEKLNAKILLLQKTQGDLDALSGMSASARNQLTSALSAAQGGVETFMSAQERARTSEELTIRSIQARTVAERAAIAVERERLNLAGQAVEGGAAERQRREDAARRAVLAQSTRDSEERLRDANDKAGMAGLTPYQRQRAELD